jgi:hypothetical protein
MTGRNLAKNIIIVYIDAISRVRAMNKLPKTMKWFEDHSKVQVQSKEYSDLKILFLEKMITNLPCSRLCVLRLWRILPTVMG